jgi:hypothetical protein
MGAVFEGQCRYVQDPLKTDAAAVSPAGQLAPPSAVNLDHEPVMSGVVVTSAP